MDNKNTAIAVSVAALAGAVLVAWMWSSSSPKGRKRSSLILPPTLEPDSPVSASPPPSNESLSKFAELLQSVALAGPTEAQAMELAAALEEIAKTSGSEGLKAAEMISAKFHDALGQWLFFRILRRQGGLAFSPVTGLPASPSAGVQGISERIAGTIRRAYWDKHRADLNNGDRPDYTQVMLRIEELRTRIASYMPVSKRADFASQLDLHLVKQLVENGAFDVDSFCQIAETIDRMLLRVESPASHEVTHEFVKKISRETADNVREAGIAGLKKFNDTIIDALSFFFSQCDVLEAELENFKISQISATERRKAELRSFAAAVDVGLVRIEKIEKFVKSMPLDAGHNFAGFLFFEFFKNFQSQIEAGNFPETLNLDSSEISQLQNSWVCLLRLFTVTASLPALMPAAARPSTVEKIWPLLLSDASPGQVAAAVCVDRGKRNLADAAIAAAIALDGAVADLMRKRLIKAMEEAAAQQLQGHPGRVSLGTLQFAEDRATELHKKLIEFCADHLSVYGEYYKNKYLNR